LEVVEVVGLVQVIDDCVQSPMTSEDAFASVKVVGSVTSSA